MLISSLSITFAYNIEMINDLKMAKNKVVVIAQKITLLIEK
jgi:hypothetical protein